MSANVDLFALFIRFSLMLISQSMIVTRNYIEAMSTSDQVWLYLSASFLPAVTLRSFILYQPSFSRSSSTKYLSIHSPEIAGFVVCVFCFNDFRYLSLYNLFTLWLCLLYLHCHIMYTIQECRSF